MFRNSDRALFAFSVKRKLPFALYPPASFQERPFLSQSRNLELGQRFLLPRAEMVKGVFNLLADWFARKNSRLVSIVFTIFIVTDMIQVRTITNSIVPFQSGSALS